MERVPHSDTQHDRITIDTIEGLKEFLDDYVKDVYEEFSELASYDTAHDKVVRLDVERGQRAYKTLTEYVQRRLMVLEYGGLVTEENVETIQKLYDELTTARDHLKDMSEDEAGDEEILHEKIQKDITSRSSFQNRGLLRIVSDEADTKPVPITPPVTPARAVPERTPLFTKADALTPIIDTLTRAPEYQTFLAKQFPSPAAFQAFVRRYINDIEKSSQLDHVLGIEHASAFDTLLRDMTLEQVEAFDDQPTAAIRDQLMTKNIPYESYVDWITEYEENYRHLVGTDSTMTFGELLVRALIMEVVNKNQSVVLEKNSNG